MPRETRMSVMSAAGESKSVTFTPMIVGGTGEDPFYLIHAFIENSTVDELEPAWPQVFDEREDAAAVGGAGATVGSPVSPDVRRLTAREHEVLHLVSMGWETRRIANELNISPHTVLNHIRHFRRKLNAPTKLDAVVTAIRLGILPIG